MIISCRKYFVFIIFIFLVSPVFVLAEQIDINSATLAQLGKIVHVGEKIAQKIIDGRPYSSVSDLNRVKGIGNGKYFQDIINQGWACVNCHATLQNLDVADKSPAGVLINEILPNPEGADESEEWFELFNQNNFDVDLSGWIIKDTTGTVTNFKVLNNTKILANGFLTFKRPDTKIMLNNDEDGLILYSQDGKQVDAANFKKAPLGQSFNKTINGWAWSTNITPGSKNIITQKNVTSVKNKKANNNLATKESLANTESVEDLLSRKGEASISGSSPFFLFIATGFAVLSAAIIVFMKKYWEQKSPKNNSDLQ